ncbi:MAG: hypothetical protein AAF609_20190 [Cyanobacteria bacterium P01_C01_bin.120]
MSTAKTIFLLISMVGWLIVGASLMYLFPAIADQFFGNERTHLWITNLARGGYQPRLALWGGGAALVLTTLLNIIWYQQFESRV